MRVYLESNRENDSLVPQKTTVLVASNNSFPLCEAEREKSSAQQQAWHNAVPHGPVASAKKRYIFIVLRMDALCADAARAALAAVGLSNVGPCLPNLSSGAHWLHRTSSDRLVADTCTRPNC